jgi:hypothetical protein
MYEYHFNPDWKPWPHKAKWERVGGFKTDYDAYEALLRRVIARYPDKWRFNASVMRLAHADGMAGDEIIGHISEK